jgi:UDP-glucose 4-epimerase
MKKKAIVTGGCGFIGSAAVDVLLTRGYEVYVIDNLSLGRDRWGHAPVRPELVMRDILDSEGLAHDFARIQPQLVLHMAAHHYIPFCEANPYEAYRLNVGGTLNVLEACRRSPIERFFFASSGDVYAPAFVPHREIDMVSPIYVYGHTKYLGEQLCAKFFETHVKGAAIIGRLFNATGPRETNPHLIPEVVRQIVSGKRVIEVGNLWPKRDFVDVRSMASVIVDLTEKASGTEIVNVGSGIVQEIGAVLELLRAAAPHSVEIVSVPQRQRPNDRPYLCPDVARLKRLNGSAAAPFAADTARAIFAEANPAS